MNKNIQIFKTDSRQTRRAKKSFRKKLKAQKKKRGYVGILTGTGGFENIKIPKSIKYSREIQDFYEINKTEKWARPREEIVFDEGFCLFKNPDKVLTTLLNTLKLAKLKCDAVNLKYQGEVSFGALYFIDMVSWQIAKKRLWRLNHDNFPEKSVLILRNLRSIYTNQTDTGFAYILNREVLIDRNENEIPKQQHIQISKEIRDLILKGLRETNGNIADLTNVEHTAIDSAISEHFDNILLHAPKSKYGYICGFFDREKNEVTILIYNFGDTIAETLERGNLPKHVDRAVKEIVENHTKKYLRLFKDFTKENALTLLALQEGISSKLFEDKSRGHGLIDFIGHCKELNTNSKIVIISGNTAIKIDSEYEIVNVEFLDRKRRMMTFNKESDIFTKPDNKKVLNLQINFPGVIIETVIPLIIKNATDASTVRLNQAN